MLDLVIFAVAFLALVIVAIIKFYPSSKFSTTIPGLLPSSKEDGNLGDITQAGNLHEFLMGLHSRFGSIAGFWWGKNYMVSIASPELLKEQNNIFDRPPFMFKSFEILIGRKSIQFANGSEARSRRKTYDHVFAFDKMPQYLCHFEELAKKTEAKWMQKGEDDHIPVSVDCLEYMIHASSLAMMGDYYKDEKVFNQFKTCYEEVWDAMERSICMSMVKDKEQQEHFDKALDFLRTSIKEVVANRKNSTAHHQEGLLIDVLIDNSPDEETLLDDAITYLVGGFHTSSTLVTWALYFIASHKDVQDKLFAEIINVIGEDGPIDKHNFREFVYLNQVIDETLRCAVIAPTVTRFQDCDSELGGHKIPKNTPVIHALGVIMRNEKLWPQPEKFDPDRFSPENRKKMSTFTFTPFGFAGKRKCPGYKFANWDSIVFLTTLLRRFEIHMCEGQVISPAYGLVTHPDKEIWVTVTKRIL